MGGLVKRVGVGVLAFVVGAAIAATAHSQSVGGDGDGYELSLDDLALSVASCEAIGTPSEEIQWCTDAETAAAIDPAISERAEAVGITEVGEQITATLPDASTTLVTSHPGGGE
jgi:hypothetical protein